MKTRIGWLVCLFALSLFGCEGDESCTPVCGDAVCGDDGCGGSCGTCEADLSCVEGACSTCGNGIKEDSETCDPSADRSCASETGCVSENACFRAVFSGAEATCDAQCVTTAVEECVSGDGCCPAAGCTPADDTDCAPESCGNGMLEANEACDPPEFPCPDVCEPTQACESAKLWGYAEGCTLECKRQPIVDCAATADGCCPPSCNSDNDADCEPAVCGDGAITGDETCDTQFVYPAAGSCSPDCSDNRSCTIDLPNGTLAGCDVSCQYSAISGCTPGDGCCPAGCTTANDSDCNNVTCGDGNVDGDEGCDNALAAGLPGSCPTDVAQCDDGDPCTDDSITGVSGDCSAKCTNTPRACADGDGCCPYTCSPSQDAECAALNLCDNYCADALSYCVGDNQLFAAEFECEDACKTMPIGHLGDDAGDSIYCRLHHLMDAVQDPDQHCVHASVTPPDGCN